MKIIAFTMNCDLFNLHYLHVGHNLFQFCFISAEMVVPVVQFRTMLTQYPVPHDTSTVTIIVRSPKRTLLPSGPQKGCIKPTVVTASSLTRPMVSHSTDCFKSHLHKFNHYRLQMMPLRIVPIHQVAANLS